MGDPNLKCPLCCDKTFSSKQLLAEHLSYVSGNIVCPVCKNKWSSIAHLIEHLVLDNCEPEPNNDNIQQSNLQLDQKPFLKLEHSEDDISNETENRINMPVDETSKLYEEYIDKNHDNSNFQIQEPGFIKLIDESGESRYMILTHQAPSSNPEQVTKQNGDGTISLGSLSVLNTESDTLITQDNDPEDQEVYSCSTCDVSFASVIEHIQNYHNDQEVVLEEPMDEDHKYVTTTPMRMQTEELVTRRVITDMGDIVESTQLVEPESTVTDSVVTSSVNTIKEPVSVETTHVKGQPNRRYVRIEKFCDSIIKDISIDKDKQSGPYHKVVIKEMATQTGTVIKVFYCVTCLTYVTTLNDFKKKPCKTLKYSCPHCPVAYDNSKSLCAHMKVHKVKTLPESSEISSVFQCEICSTNFPTNKSLKLHKRMHDPVKERADGTKTVPENGEPEDDSSIGHYLCTVCNKRIPTEYTEIHQNSHLAGEKINCYICNKKFSSLEYLHMHMTVHVTDDKAPAANSEKSLPYPCSYCKRAFARPHEKVKHERIHTGEKPHACVICGKSFRVSYCLTLHMRTHTGARPYACPQCPKRFKALSVYNHHLLTHSEVRAYKCPFCPKAFKTLVQLAGHKNSHTKPFQCQHCNRPFASLYAVRIHTETHSRQNNLRFSCAKCGASYARAFALKDHMKQAHGDVADVTDDKDDEEIIAMEYPDPDAITKISDDQMEELVVMNSDELIIS